MLSGISNYIFIWDILTGINQCPDKMSVQQAKSTTFFVIKMANASASVKQITQFISRDDKMLIL